MFHTNSNQRHSWLMFASKKSHTVKCQLSAITHSSPSNHQMITKTDLQNDMKFSIISMLVNFYPGSFIWTICFRTRLTMQIKELTLDS